MAKLIPIHCSLGEVKALNYMQGGQYIDPDSGLREYSRLSPIFKDEAARQLFVKLAAMVHTHKRLPDDVTNFTKGLAKQEGIGQYYTKIPSDDEPEIKALERMGQGKDNKVVMMPLDVVKFLDSLRKTSKVTSLNRRTGLEQFDFFEDIIQSASAILGGVFGGKKDPKQELEHNEPTRAQQQDTEERGVLPFPQEKFQLNKQIPEMGILGEHYDAPALKDVRSPKANYADIFKNAATPKLSSKGFKEGVTAKAVTPRTNIESIDPRPWEKHGLTEKQWHRMIMEMKEEQKRLREKTEETKKARSFSKKDILPLSAMGTGVFFKHRALKDKQKQLRQMNAGRQSDLNAILSKTNFNEPMRYAKGDHVGRPIVGKGKGQEDLIKDDKVREGSWIWDASTVGHCGDGSTKAGQQELEKLEKFVTGGHSKRFQNLAAGGKATKTPIVPCALSDGERATPTAIVTAAGDGDNEKGAARFRAVTKYLRRHKISNGTELPPAAPDIIKLFKKVG